MHIDEGVDSAGTGHNADFPWDSFDSESYFAHNYRSMRHDDRRIVEFIRDFFTAADIPEDARGIDVGTGPNLYPTLALLPFCSQIELYEFSAHNIAWLHGQSTDGWPSWNDGLAAFWELYTHSVPYKACGSDPRSLLSSRARIVQGSVFDLQRDAGDRFDVGTMFFVAESLSDDRAEFELAVNRFLEVLRPGAPFAAAFMEGSEGYDVDGVRFPAIAVDSADVKHSLERSATDVVLERIGTDGLPLRPGYSGMIIAVGRAKGTTEDR
jgi:hypothetical protein